MNLVHFLVKVLDTTTIITLEYVNDKEILNIFSTYNHSISFILFIS